MRSSVGSVFGLKTEKGEENKVQEVLDSSHTVHSALLIFHIRHNIDILVISLFRKKM